MFHTPVPRLPDDPPNVTRALLVPARMTLDYRVARAEQFLKLISFVIRARGAHRLDKVGLNPAWGQSATDFLTEENLKRPVLIMTHLMSVDHSIYDTGGDRIERTSWLRVPFANGVAAGKTPQGVETFKVYHGLAARVALGDCRAVTWDGGEILAEVLGTSGSR